MDSQPTTTRRPGGQCAKRPCEICGGLAELACSVLIRAMGFGQGHATRTMKLSKSVFFCASCVSSQSFLTPLYSKAGETIEHVQRVRWRPGKKKPGQQGRTATPKTKGTNPHR